MEQGQPSYLAGGSLDVGTENITGSLSLNGEQTSTLTGAQNDFALNSGVAILRWNGASTATITGFTGGVNGRLLYVVNESAVLLTLSHQTTSAAANQIVGVGSASLNIGVGGSVLLRYDGTSTKWRVMSFATTNFLSSLNVNGVFQIAPQNGEQTDTSTGTQNDFAVNSAVSVLRWNGASTATFTGFAGGTNGRLLLVINESTAQGVTFNNENASSTAANRFTILNSSSEVIGALGAALFRYDGASSRWRLVLINTNQINATLTAAANVSFSSFQNPTSISGTNNDWAPTSGYRYRVTASAAATITGLASGVSGGRICVVSNISAFNITLTNEGAGSTAANRFTCPRSVDLVVPPGGNCFLIYDSTTSRWIVEPDSSCWAQGASTLSGDIIAPPLAAGRFYCAPNSRAASGTISNNVFRCSPFYISNTVTITQLGADVSVVGEAGSKLRLGIYADDGNGRPGALVLDAGQVAGDALGNQLVTGLTTTIGPGYYWFGIATQSAPTTVPTIRLAGALMGPCPTIDLGTSAPTSGADFNGWAQTASGALPGTFTGGGYSSACPRLIFKT